MIILPFVIFIISMEMRLEYALRMAGFSSSLAKKMHISHFVFQVFYDFVKVAIQSVDIATSFQTHAFLNPYAVTLSQCALLTIIAVGGESFLVAACRGVYGANIY